MDGSAPKYTGMNFINPLATIGAGKMGMGTREVGSLIAKLIG